MTEPELSWLAFQAVTHRCIVEVGSYLGRSTRVLADNTPGKVYALDDWYGPRDVDWMTEEHRAGIYDQFLLNMAGVDDKVIPVRADHNQVVHIYEAPDMVFIDGDHEFENVKRDIDRWLPQVVPGGLISGHDAEKPGVAKAIREAFGAVAVVPGTSIWWVEVGDAFFE